MRCTECETVDVEGPRHCECCGRPLNAAASPAAETAVVDADCGWASFDTPPDEAAPTEALSQPARGDDAFTALAPAPSAFCPPPDSFEHGAGASAPVPDEVPLPAPGSHEYLQSHEGYTTHDTGHVTDRMALHGVVVTDRATTPHAAAARADEMTSSLLADHAVRDLNPDDEMQVPPPWWATRATSSAPVADEPASSEAAPVETALPAPVMPEAATAAALAPSPPLPPAREERPRQPRPSPPRRLPRAGSSSATARAAQRPARRPARFLAPAAVALIAVSVAALLGAPTLRQWSGSAGDATSSALPAPPVEATTAHHVDAVAPAMADTAPTQPGRHGPWRDTSPHAGETAAPTTRPATTQPARTSKASRRFTLAVPTRPAEPVAHRENLEPIAAAPLALASTNAVAAPPTVATPAPAVVAPIEALEVTKVDVKPEVVKRVNARAAKAGSATPEMVVLRVLVSASGSPATVHVLRGSKLDPTNDGVAVEAVKQWAFSPAMKRGRPVDCWFNVAVPVEGTAQ